MRHAAAVLLAAAIASPAFADVRLPKIFTDHMVLQRGIKLPIWGWAEPGEEVTIKFNDQTVKATAGNDKVWKAELAPMEAGGPFEMTVVANNTETIKDVLVGDVWVCSGQSNMQFGLGGANNAAEEIAKSDHPQIRLFTVQNIQAAEPVKDVPGGPWVACSPATSPGFTAVGYFFGRKLNEDLKVPIGLINAPWSGSPVEQWYPPQTLATDPVLAPLNEQSAAAHKQYTEAKAAYDAAMKKWNEENEIAKLEDKEAPNKPKEPVAPMSHGAMWNGMIAPIVPMAIKGVIWYQGESNAPQAYRYRSMFPAMITGWRKVWGQGDFPFLFVQLANYTDARPEPSDSSWAELREAQLMTLSLPNTAMATAVDVGEAKDIHPKNKQDVGLRLALAAEATVYGVKDLVYSGPIFESMAIEGDKARLKFKQLGGGLVFKGDAAKSFAIAGEDKKFIWADAAIDGDTVVVSSKDVPKPVSVRYGWADNPTISLYNKEGLPASPFRTDDWPGATERPK